jgi:putative ABC transport system permease protein
MHVKTDFGFVVRGLLKDKAFTFISVATLALGIGANSAIFSVINAVLLRPLPFKNPERMVRLWEARGNFTGSVSWPNLQDWRQQNTTLEALAAAEEQDFTLGLDASPQRLSGAKVSPEFFNVFEVQPIIGRPFAVGEAQPGSPQVMIISEGLWRQQFGADTSVIGKTVTLEGKPHTVVGVMPTYLRFPRRDVQAWVPLTPTPHEATDRGHHYLEVFGRLKAGVPIDQSRREMVVIARRIEQLYPEQVGRSVQIENLQEFLIRRTRPGLVALLGAVVFVLLIACSNVANLLLARSTARRRETAIRTALGATRAQLLRLFVMEGLVIALLGGIFGVLIAKICMSSLVAWASPYLPRIQDVKLNMQVLLFSVLLSVLTGIICGLIPGFQSARQDIQQGLKQGGTSAGSPQSSWLTGLLAAGESTAAMVLLISAGLLMKSVLRCEQVDPGLQVRDVVTMKMSLPAESYQPQQAAHFYNELIRRVSDIHGVRGAGVINLLPLEAYGYNSNLEIEGLPRFVNDSHWAIECRFISPGYFRAFNIPLIKGREFAEADLEHDALYAVVNETFARMLSQYADPLGRRIMNTRDDPKIGITIVGVVGDVHQSGLDAPVRPEAYFLNDTPRPDVNAMNLIVRTTGDSAGLVDAVRREVAKLDANQTVYDVKTMQTLVDDSISSRRFTRNLILLFALIGTILTVVGIYSVLSYLLSQHTREIGIRLALGAQRANVMSLVLKQGVQVGLLGVAGGITCSLILTRFLSSMLFGVKTYDPATFAGVSLLLLTVTVLASYVPAQRTTRVDPMTALRQD